MTRTTPVKPRRGDKWNAANRRAIVAGLATGNWPVVVCRTVGVSKRQYYRWMERGRDLIAVEEEGGRKLTAAELLFVEFVHDVDQADAKAEQKIVNRMCELAEEAKDWRGLAAMVKMRWSDRWSEKTGTTIEVGEGAEKGLEIKLAFPIREPQNQTEEQLQALADQRGLA